MLRLTLLLLLGTPAHDGVQHEAEQRAVRGDRPLVHPHRLDPQRREQLDRAVDKGRLPSADRDAALGRISPGTELAHAFDARLTLLRVVRPVVGGRTMYEG